jgi:uncharacterized protein (DUF2267 family)
MSYKDLIKKVQEYSGFSDSESKDALQLMVESLSVHLTEHERREFAGQLPDELRDIALSVWATEEIPGSFRETGQAANSSCLAGSQRHGQQS